MNDITIQCQTQNWGPRDKMVMVATDEDGLLLGTVQVELYPCPQRNFGGTAYLHSLWVTKPYRKRGVATRLMRYAEEIAASKGHKTISLEWDVSESPQWVCRWYARLGYDEKEFTPGHCALMVKKL